jgi:DnaJ family protein A protein 2
MFQQRPQHTELYDIMEIDTLATPEIIKKAYRGLAMKHHPDKGGDSAKFKTLQKAYDILSNEKKRQIYDRYGEDALVVEQPQHFNIFNLFVQKQRKSKDVLFIMKVSLTELYSGSARKIKIQSNKPCCVCHGKGSSNVGKTDVTECVPCVGSGMLSETNVVTVAIRRGMFDGDRIVLVGLADQQVNEIAGDVIVLLKQELDEQYTRKSDDLYIEKSISFIQAVRGPKIQLRHLRGDHFCFETHGIAQHGDVFKIKQRGMPTNSGDYGDLYVAYKIIIPNVRHHLLLLENIFPEKQEPFDVKKSVQAIKIKK